jgi:lipopolysaccharide transport system ATP-binding protein
MSVIEINNISKKFKVPSEKRYTIFQNIIGILSGNLNNEIFWALKDVSFGVEKGETLGIIGRNGSGKSTLLKIMAKVLYPDSGNIMINGRVASFLELGVGFQPELTARDNVYLYSYILGVGRHEINNNYADIMDFAELRRFQNLKLKKLSTGMQLRLAFSTAIHINPEIMLVDEVLAVGDLDFQKKCVDKMNDLKNKGKTIIFVSHDIEMVKNICTRALLLRGGKMVSLGPTNEVLDEYLAAENEKLAN